MKSHSPVTSLLRTAHRRRGFTFMEILFAVMILGIGFIMVAAMFPAALKQTQGNVEENEFNVICATAAHDMENLAYCTDSRMAAYARANPPPPGTPATQAPRFLDQITSWIATDNNQPVEYDSGSSAAQPDSGRPIPFSFHDPRLKGVAINYPDGNPPAATDAMWDFVRGNLIMPDRKQDAWVPLWSRTRMKDPSAPGGYRAGSSMQLFIFPVHSRTKPQYDPYAGTTTAKNPACDLTYTPANLDPALINFHYSPPNGNLNAPNGVLEVFKLYHGVLAGVLVDPSSAPAANPVAEGCYVVVSDSAIAANSAKFSQYRHGAIWNGLVFKIGPEVKDPSGNSGTSNGQYWSVAGFENYPSGSPYNQVGPQGQQPVTGDPKKDIAPDDFTARNIFGLVVGRQPDPVDSFQQSDQIRSGKSTELLNRAGPAQEMGYFPYSVVVK